MGVFGPVKQRWRVILKNYKIKTKAMNITKERFPSLIKQLWERSITAEHLQGGFRAVGLVPFNPNAVKSSQFAPSLQVAEGRSTYQAIEGEFTATLTLHHSETLIRTELRGYFREVLKPNDGQQKPKRRPRVELSCTGEVLTSDGVVERIERADAERAAKKKSGGKKGKNTQSSMSRRRNTRGESTKTATQKQDADEVSCENCGQVYTDAESDSWIGCDTCETWWHYWCAGLQSMLSEEDEWFCEHCLTLTDHPSTNISLIIQ